MLVMPRSAIYSIHRTLSISSKRFEPVKDPFCDPENPKILEFGDISLAHHRIQGGIVRTDCRKSRCLSQLYDMDIHLKMEVNQDTGSFKERGARFALQNLSEEKKKAGVYAASAGNHALALSLHGRQLGVDINVVMPKIAPLMKINRCQDLGANVLVEGADIAESREIALRMAQEKGGTYINGFDHYDILAGAGTIGIEILEQVTKPDAVIVPVGGCGLIAGVATAVKTLSPSTQVIGVVSETCQAIIKSLQAGTPVYTPTRPTLADGLAVPSIGVNAFASLLGKVDKVISVAENDIAVSILRLIENEKVVCEGAGAVSIAAIRSGKLDYLKGKTVVPILSGGNIDSTSLGRCIERGLAYDHRVIRLSVIIPDQPGGISKLTKIIGEMSANVRDFYLERAFLRNDMSSQRVKMVIEVRGKEHEEQLKQRLKDEYNPTNCSFKNNRLPML
uniref:Serine racemase n=1 Tax=Caenorhabditis japonica TaxID=281687 RepID=A0A8R1DZB1_CAEJA